jgi:hypothetical protein
MPVQRASRTLEYFAYMRYFKLSYLFGGAYGCDYGHLSNEVPFLGPFIFAHYLKSMPGIDAGGREG